MINRKLFFDCVRDNPFPGSLNQSQVDGMNYILDVWEENYDGDDLRWCAYPLATTMWETSSTMQPIEEYGKGSGQPYGVPDPTTKQTYYGRGLAQLTWRENYARADKELDFFDDDSCEWHAENALDPDKAAAILFVGMIEGWFRSDDKGPQNLPRYFNTTTDDAYGAREIINGDKAKVPSWSAGARIGDLIKGYHQGFLVALEISYGSVPNPKPGPDKKVVTITVSAPEGVEVIVTVPPPRAG
jgi:putative chitinase